MYVLENVRMLLAACTAGKVAHTNQMRVTKWRPQAAGKAEFHPQRSSWETSLLGPVGHSDLRRHCGLKMVIRGTAPFWMVPPLSSRNEVRVLVVITSHIPAAYTGLFFCSREPSKAEKGAL